MRLTEQSGFSLIELMIALAIIGILATIAIPRFLVYRERAQQAEVKTNLGALRVAEVSWYAENHGFTDDLSALAWRPEGSPRYLYGFASDAFPAPSGRNDSAELAATTPVGYATASMIVFAGVPLTAANFPAGMNVSSTGFHAGAVANIDDDATLDAWSIDEQSQFVLLADDCSS